MAKQKTEKTPLELLTKAFMEDVNDNELQLRYNGFINRSNEAKSQYNANVPIANELMNKRSALESIIFNSAIEGILSTHAIEDYKRVNSEFSEIRKEMSRSQEAIDEVEDLIKKYKELSDKKLYYWWKSFKAIDPKGTEPWLTWKRTYENKII